MNPPDNKIQPPAPEVQGQPMESGQQRSESKPSELGPQQLTQNTPQPAVNDDTSIANLSQTLKVDPKNPPKQESITANPQQRSAKRPSSEPYIKAAENVIKQDKGDPYKEEEDHENVQTQYLKDRFGKNIKKD